MDLIDTHQHLIYRDHLGYDWTDAIPVLAHGDFTIEHYRDLTAGRGIIGTIFMETGVNDADYQAEARLIAPMVGKQGLLGQIASCRPELDTGFDAWLDECSGLNVHGFRRILHVMPDDMSTTDTFRNNLRKIGAADLPFDVCMLARQLPLAVDLAHACDNQILVMDHCGVPDIAAGAFDTWAAGISQLAALPHVMIKLSGITAYCTPGTITQDLLRPWVDHVLNSFGPDRIVWGGDWPVVNMGAGLVDWIALSQDLLSELSDTDQAKIGHCNAERIYRVRTN